ncbi:MAG: aminopeptidase P N-terminal domain-containing protein [Chitinophagales bacterium]
MKYPKIKSGLFVNNRNNFRNQLKSKSLAVLHSNDIMPRNGDNTYKFRQNSDLFYLSGIDQEDTILLLFPDAPVEKYREVLFIKETNEKIKVWEGEKFTKEKAKEYSGIKTVIWNDDFDAIFNMLVPFAEHLYLNLNENDRAATEVPYKDLRFANKVKARFPLHKYERIAPIVGNLRCIKSEIEVGLLSKACEITGNAFERVLKFMKPGVMEYEVEAEILHEFLCNRATGYAYHPIVASGEAACILHYNDNNKACKDGDLLLMDFGCEYANYASDMTRTIPVNGKFTDRQKDVYNATLRVMKEATSMLRPGITLNDYNKEVGLIMEKELVQLGLLSQKDIDEQNPDVPAYKKYFPHGTAHYMGLDVHDIGNRYEVMKPGMVFTCEPGIYIPKENIGVRIENDILVTDGDPVDLMGDIPREVEEIEHLMNS